MMFRKTFWQWSGGDWFSVERRGLKWYPQISTDLGEFWIPIGKGYWCQSLAIARCKQVDAEMVKHARKA
jgi:hypothetical protein